MKSTKVKCIAIASLLASTVAFSAQAQEHYRNDDIVSYSAPVQLSKSREQVSAEARMLGPNAQDHYRNGEIAEMTQPPICTRSRAEVVAEMNQARELGQVTHGEDYPAQVADNQKNSQRAAQMAQHHQGHGSVIDRS